MVWGEKREERIGTALEMSRGRLDRWRQLRAYQVPEQRDRTAFGLVKRVQVMPASGSHSAGVSSLSNDEGHERRCFMCAQV